ADATDHDADGRYTLAVETAPEQGTGVPGDACADAVPLPRTDPSVQGDTFLARDDVAGKCGGQGAGDVVYRVEVPKRARVTAHMGSQEGQHVFVLTRTCGDR